MKKILLSLAAAGLLIVALPAGAQGLTSNQLNAANSTVKSKASKHSKARTKKVKVAAKTSVNKSLSKKVAKKPTKKKGHKKTVPKSGIQTKTNEPGPAATTAQDPVISQDDSLGTDLGPSADSGGLISRASGQGLDQGPDQGMDSSVQSAVSAGPSNAKKFAIAGIAGTSALSLLAILKKLFVH